MSEFGRLRAYIRQVMDDQGQRGEWNANSLYEAFAARFSDPDKPPVGRSVFYSWFGDKPTDQVSAKILECIPGIAAVLNVKAYSLYQAAGILPPELEAAMALGESARDLRTALGTAQETLANAGLSTAGEALVIDRLLHRGLDYRVEVWPVVRGTDMPMHFRSWIVLQPVEPNPERQRPPTARVERMSRADRRRYIRDEVITESLWRSLGLRWRDPVPREWVGPPPDLFIEIPAEERNREPTSSPGDRAQIEVRRALCVSGMWSHAEGLATLVASALKWGSFDLRYQGFDSNTDVAEKLAFCRRKLAEPSPHYIWAISERADILQELEPDILAASADTVVIWSTFGPAAAAAAAEAWRTSVQTIEESLEGAERIARKINQRWPMIRVRYDDLDFAPPDADGPLPFDRNLFADSVRYAAAAVLNQFHRRFYGPPVQDWGPRFVDLIYGRDQVAFIPTRESRVDWLDVGDADRE